MLRHSDLVIGVDTAKMSPPSHQNTPAEVRTFSWTFLRYINSKNRVYQFQKNLVAL